MTFALDIFGDRWSLIVLREMLFRKKRHYGEFLDVAEGISTNILAERLSRLQREGLITKSPDPEKGTRNVYALTDKARDLLPMLLEMIAWSVKYDPDPNMPDSVIVGAPPHLLERWRTDPEALIEDILRDHAAAP